MKVDVASGDGSNNDERTYTKNNKRNGKVRIME